MPPRGLVIPQKHLFATLRKPVDRMKKMLLLTLLSLLLLLAGCTIGIKQTPKAVRQAFDALFPGATHVEWESVLSTYKAEFYHDGHEKEAQFDKDGSWRRTKTELTFLDIPAPVMKAAQEYCDWEIDDILLFEQADGVPAYYQIEYDREQSDREKQLLLFPDGSIFTRL